MSTAAAYELQKQNLPPLPGIRWRGAIVLLAWLGLIAALASADAFVTGPGGPPILLLTAVVGPVVAFLSAVQLSARFREVMLGANLPLITAVQAWRFGGFVFLALWARGALPAYFAWPAGFGDMAIALVAPWMAVGLLMRPGFVASRTFVAWHILGILDLVIAVSLGALVPLVMGQSAGAVDTSIMGRWPLVFVPAYFVPAFVILHLAALAQSQSLLRQRSQRP